MTDYYELPYEPEEDGYIRADCGCEVYENEPVYIYEGQTYCEECWTDFWQEFVKAHPANFAHLIGAGIGLVEKAEKAYF